MSYCQANRLSQTAKWLGELLVTIQTEPKNLRKQEDQMMSEEVFSD
jgi:hypothetical protein